MFNFVSEIRNIYVNNLNFNEMRKLKIYRVHFTTRSRLSNSKSVVDVAVRAFSLKEALSKLRDRGYTISRDFYYYVYKSSECHKFTYNQFFIPNIGFSSYLV